MMNAWLASEPPLMALRTSRGMRRKQVVEALIRILGLDPAKEEKVAGYYHRLETGLLDPEQVDPRVFGALAETLKARVEELLMWRPTLQIEPKPMLRLAQPAVDLALRLPTHAASLAEEFDEVDRLFRKEA